MKQEIAKHSEQANKNLLKSKNRWDKIKHTKLEDGKVYKVYFTSCMQEKVVALYLVGA